MALNITSKVVANGSNGAFTSITIPSDTYTANNLLVLTLTQQFASAVPNNETFTFTGTSGLTWTQAKQEVSANGLTRLVTFTAPVGSANVTGTIIPHWSSTTASAFPVLYEIQTITGYNTSVPVAQAASGSGLTASNPATVGVSMAAVSDNRNRTLMIVADRSASNVTASMPTGWTSFPTGGGATGIPTSSGWKKYQPDNSGAASASIGATNTQWVAIALEIGGDPQINVQSLINNSANPLIASGGLTFNIAGLNIDIDNTVFIEISNWTSASAGPNYTPSGLGLTWHRIGVVQTIGVYTQDVWYAYNNTGAGIVNGTITMTANGSWNNDTGIYAVYQVSGLNPTGTVTNVHQTTTISTNATVTLSAAASVDNRTFAAAFNGGGNFPGPDTSFTTISQKSQAGVSTTGFQEDEFRSDAFVTSVTAVANSNKTILTAWEAVAIISTTPHSSSDTGSGNSDTAVVTIKDTDSGAGTEAASLAASEVSADTGALSEAGGPKLEKADAETVIATEAARVAQGDADSLASADAEAMSAVDHDTSTSTAEDVVASTSDLAGVTEDGALTETELVSQNVYDDDEAGFDEEAAVHTAPIREFDDGTGTDAGETSTAVLPTDPDSLTAADAGAARAALVGADSGVGTDAPGAVKNEPIPHSDGEDITAADRESVFVTFQPISDADSGFFADWVSDLDAPIKGRFDTDNGAATEAAHVDFLVRDVFDGDAAHFTEAGHGGLSNDQFWASGDFAQAFDTSGVLRATGAGGDTVTATDEETAEDVTFQSRFSADTAQGVELGALAAALASGDDVAAADAIATFLEAYRDTDAGVAAEDALLGPVAGDNGTATDRFVQLFELVHGAHSADTGRLRDAILSAFLPSPSDPNTGTFPVFEEVESDDEESTTADIDDGESGLLDDVESVAAEAFEADGAAGAELELIDIFDDDAALFAEADVVGLYEGDSGAGEDGGEEVKIYPVVRPPGAVSIRSDKVAARVRKPVKTVVTSSVIGVRRNGD